MVDRSQPRRSDQDDRPGLPSDNVDGRRVASQGHHQAAGTFDQYDVIARGQLIGAVDDLLNVDRFAGQGRRQMRGRGKRIDRRAGEPLLVFWKQVHAHQAAMDANVFAGAQAPCLHQLLVIVRRP